MSKTRYFVKKLLSVWLLLAGLHTFGIAVALLERDIVDSLAFISLLSCALLGVFNKK